MNFVSVIALIVGSAIIGMYIGLSLHELTHYMIGKLVGANANIETGQFYLPHQVVFENPNELSTTAIRTATGLVIIYPVSLILFLWFSRLPNPGIESFVLFVLCGASGVSPADLLGMLYPNQWREYANNYSGEGHIETLHILINEIRKTNSNSQRIEN